jgi:hypothetical protein
VCSWCVASCRVCEHSSEAWCWGLRGLLVAALCIMCLQGCLVKVAAAVCSRQQQLPGQQCMQMIEF